MADKDELLGLLEPRAEEVAKQLHELQAAGNRTSDMALASPMLISLAISLKRIADTLENVTGSDIHNGTYIDTRDGRTQ